MTINDLKNFLNDKKDVNIKLPNGTHIPNHYHLTEVGRITKDFIDCGNTKRSEVKASIQLWVADDIDHRLVPEKFIKILNKSDELFNIGDVEIEVEYQGDTIRKFGLSTESDHLILTQKETACLAADACNVELPQINISEMAASQCCAPGGGCC